VSDASRRDAARMNHAETFPFAAPTLWRAPVIILAAILRGAISKVEQNRTSLKVQPAKPVEGEMSTIT
jgi:hypothetical protein